MDMTKYVRSKKIAGTIILSGLLVGAASHVVKSELLSILSFGLLLAGIYQAFKTAEE